MAYTYHVDRSMSFIEDEYNAIITGYVQDFWFSITQIIISSRNGDGYTMNKKCEAIPSGNTSRNSLFSYVKEIESARKKYTEIFRTDIVTKDMPCFLRILLLLKEGGQILLEVWKLTLEEISANQKRKAFPDFFDDLQQCILQTISSLPSLPCHKLVMDQTSYSIAYQMAYGEPDSDKLCSLGEDYETHVLDYIQTNDYRLTLSVDYRTEEDFQKTYAEFITMNARKKAQSPSPHRRRRRSRDRSGTSPELQFVPDDMLLLGMTSNIPEHPEEESTEEGTKDGAVMEGLIDINCAFVNESEILPQELKNTIITSHRLSRQEDELMESFHKTLSLEKLVEAKKTAEEGQLLQEKLDMWVPTLSKQREHRKSSGNLSRQSSLPTKSPFVAVPPVKLNSSYSTSELKNASGESRGTPTLGRGIKTPSPPQMPPSTRLANQLAIFSMPPLIDIWKLAPNRSWETVINESFDHTIAANKGYFDTRFDIAKFDSTPLAEKKTNADDLTGFLNMIKDFREIKFTPKTEINLSYEEQMSFFEGVKESSSLLVDEIKQNRLEKEKELQDVNLSLHD